MAQVLAAAVGALIAGIFTYVVTSWKVRKALELAYDKDLRGRRIICYQALWQLLEPLAQYARPGPVSYATLSELARELRAWYFEQGGLFLSDGARHDYFALQEGLKAVLASAVTPHRRLSLTRRLSKTSASWGTTCARAWQET